MPRRIASLAIVVLTGSVALPLAIPAASAAEPVVGSGAFVRTAPFIDGYLVTFTCSVTAPGAQSTSIDTCNLVNNSYVAASAPSATSQTPMTTAVQTVAVPATTYQVCWSGTARYSDGTSATTSGCSTASALGGAG